MKLQSKSVLKQELTTKTKSELIEICLCLSSSKKENKEILTYLLMYKNNEADFVLQCKDEISSMFQDVNQTSPYFAKKTIRKILRRMNSYTRMSIVVETEVKLIIHFCTCMKMMTLAIEDSNVLLRIYQQQIDKVEKLLLKLHPDLQYDYRKLVSGH